MKHSRLAFSLGLIVAAAVARILPYPWNFTPVGGVALFAGAHLRSKWLAYTVPLAAVPVSDLVVGRTHECDHPPAVKSLPACAEPKLRIDAPSRENDRQVKELLAQAPCAYRAHADALKRPDSMSSLPRRNARCVPSTCAMWNRPCAIGSNRVRALFRLNPKSFRRSPQNPPSRSSAKL